MALMLASLVVTVVLGFRSSSKANPPNPLESWLLACAAAGLQVAAGVSFGKAGKADPSHARSSVRHLRALGVTAGTARQLAEGTFDEMKPSNPHRAALGQLSVHLSAIEEDALLAVEDWRDFHPDVIKDLMNEEKKAQEQQ
ncbi:hypothetical protein [Micromonospora chalcea]|uniref:hypothetical protein n=1 Tax=Micromonospora chalcea TaxID=1874 RepID=UPI00331D228E